ncbi:hypothetical protein OIV83_000792 [Microbotryomycetes sp. JL201]|nr:hypothetical protein OIV83_000792 [Microbotryomycetes sp. JL201]
MRVNESTVLANDKVVLVPYRRHHVPKYHDWMQDASVLEATASERLTLQQEYDMQEMTFIILKRDPNVSVDDTDFMASHDNDEHMIGDVNVFISTDSDDDDDQLAELDSKDNAVRRRRDTRRAELEIMIASPDDRRQGYAASTLRMFLPYVSKILSISPDRFFARIGASNVGSIRLFEKLGFKRGKLVQVFDEQQMDWDESRGTEWAWSLNYAELYSEAEPLVAPSREAITN